MTRKIHPLLYTNKIFFLTTTQKTSKKRASDFHKPLAQQKPYEILNTMNLISIF